MHDTVYCEGCGAPLLNNKCIYCGIENDYYFVTKEDYNKIIRSDGFVWGALKGFSTLETYFGRKIVVRN